MTDLLTRDPNDTGDIPRIDPVGEGTRNLSEYARHLPPTNVLRRPDATGELPLVESGQPAPPSPLPAPTESDAEFVWDYARPDTYVGRHRAPEDLPAEVPPGRFGALRSVLASAWARVRGSV